MVFFLLSHSFVISYCIFAYTSMANIWNKTFLKLFEIRRDFGLVSTYITEQWIFVQTLTTDLLLNGAKLGSIASGDKKKLLCTIKKPFFSKKSQKSTVDSTLHPSSSAILDGAIPNLA